MRCALFATLPALKQFESDLRSISLALEGLLAGHEFRLRFVKPSQSSSLVDLPRFDTHI